MDDKPTPKGKDARKDGSVRFKCIGGPLHEVIVRVWPPYDVLAFPGNDGQTVTYELHPPARKNGHWVYVHTENPDATE